MGKMGRDLSMLAAGAVLFAFAMVSAPVAASEAPRDDWLLPTSKWEVNYGDAECRLMRRFGTGDGAIYMEITRSLTFESYGWGLYGATLPAYSAVAVLEMELEPQKTSHRLETLSYEIPGAKRALKWGDEGRSISSTMRGDQRVRITGRKLDLRLQLSEIEPAFKALEACQDDLLAGWGIDLKQWHALKTKVEPIGSPAYWATSDDYLAVDRAQKNEGLVTFVLAVSAKGKTTDCRIVKSSGFASLDKRTCHMMLARSAFRPAKDSIGNAVPSHYINSVFWQLPK